jgi:hypothetical protein
MWADHRCHRVQRYHGGLTPPALGRECERYGNRAYSSCKFDRNVAAFGNAPSTHAYSSCGLDTLTMAGACHPLLVACADAVANVRFWPTKKMLFHGGLAPPAPACTTFVRCEKRHSRCRNAHPVKRGMRQPAAIEASELFTVSRALFRDGCRAFVQHGYGRLIMVEGEPRVLPARILSMNVSPPGPPSKKVEPNVGSDTTNSSSPVPRSTVAEVCTVALSSCT